MNVLFSLYKCIVYLESNRTKHIISTTKENIIYKIKNFFFVENNNQF